MGLGFGIFSAPTTSSNVTCFLRLERRSDSSFGSFSGEEVVSLAAILLGAVELVVAVLCAFAPIETGEAVALVSDLAGTARIFTLGLPGTKDELSVLSNA
jgi:hypothetical protein